MLTRTGSTAPHITTRHPAACQLFVELPRATDPAAVGVMVGMIATLPSPRS